MGHAKRLPVEEWFVGAILSLNVSQALGAEQGRERQSSEQGAHLASTNSGSVPCAACVPAELSLE